MSLEEHSQKSKEWTQIWLQTWCAIFTIIVCAGLIISHIDRKSKAIQQQIEGMYK